METQTITPPFDWAKEDASLAAIIGPGFTRRDKGPDFASLTRAVERDVRVVRYFTTYPNASEEAADIARQDLACSAYALYSAIKKNPIKFFIMEKFAKFCMYTFGTGTLVSVGYALGHITFGKGDVSPGAAAIAFGIGWVAGFFFGLHRRFA